MIWYVLVKDANIHLIILILIIGMPQWIYDGGFKNRECFFWCMGLDKGLKDQEGQTQVSGSVGLVGFFVVGWLCFLFFKLL